MPRTPLTLLCALMLALAVASCSRLSGDARKITGRYVMPELSQDQPVMELNGDATCTVRAIRPGVITYRVDGTWNVERDSLLMWLDLSTLEVEGDTALVGDIPRVSARKVVGHTQFGLELESGGIVYYYKKLP